MGSKAAAEKAGSKGSVGGPSRSPTPGVSYLEVGSSVHLLEASWIASVAYNEHEKRSVRFIHQQLDSFKLREQRCEEEPLLPVKLLEFRFPGHVGQR